MSDHHSKIILARKASALVTAQSASVRVGWIRALKHKILEEEKSLLDRIQLETRKCRSDALMSELFPLVDWLKFLEQNTERLLNSETVRTPLTLMGKKSRIFFEPYGVILAITPWNYPLYQTLLPITNALVTGNAVIVKPSEWTPLHGVIEHLLQSLSIPEHAVQIAYGDGQVGSDLIAAKPDKIFFTGSAATGAKVLAAAAPHLIPVELELGGKDPMIVFADANLERAVAGALWGGFTNSGQSCTSVERLYVQANVADAFRAKLLERLPKLTLGIDSDGSKDVGEMTQSVQRQIVVNQLQQAQSQGARLLEGGTGDRSNASSESDGLQLRPTVVEGAPESASVWTDETFGPVLALETFETEEDAIHLANQGAFGLSASVWSQNIERATQVALRLQVGNVSINNVMVTEANPFLPFGGNRQSGFGRIKGESGFRAFQQSKSILIDQNSAKIEAHWYPYTPEKFAVFSRMMHGWARGGVSGLWQFIWNGLQLESLARRLWG